MKIIRNKFFPDETISKVLISSTSRFLGSFESDSNLLTHAWRSFSDPIGNYSLEESPITRNAFIFAFETEPLNKMVGITVPNYSFIGNIVCSYLSVLFGKRFDNHGLIESVGNFRFPDLSSSLISICDSKLPFNSFKKRNSFSIDLNLQYFRCFERMFIDREIETKFRHTFDTCCKFYWQALKTVEVDAEIAYLNLITAGEVLSNYFEYSKEELIDEDTLILLKIIEKELDKGKEIRNNFESKMRSIKSKYVKTIMNFIDDDFFQKSNVLKKTHDFNKVDFEKNIKASYDLRSKFTHTGLAFGNWIKPGSGYSDLPIGLPVTNDSNLNKILSKAPLFNGLERVIRYVLLKFYESELSINILQHETQ